MTDEHYRAINRAIALVSYSNQDEREAARTALHHIFGRENRLREFSKAKGEIIVGYQRNVLKLQDENAKLREENEGLRAEQDNAGFVPWRLAQDALDEREAELAKLREELQKTQGGRWDDLFQERYRLVDENARLREALEKIERGKTPAVGWQPVVPEVSLTQKEMQDIARNALAELKGGTP